MKRAKIVCTFGPVSETDDVLERMIEFGRDVVRLNFSHGTYEAHAKPIQMVRNVLDRVWSPPTCAQEQSLHLPYWAPRPISSQNADRIRHSLLLRQIR